MKACTACGKVKGAGSFYTNKARPDGLTTRCRKCLHESYERKRIHAGKVPGKPKQVTTRQRQWAFRGLFMGRKQHGQPLV